MNDILDKFLGCIVLGDIPDDVARAIDALVNGEFPAEYSRLLNLWWRRNPELSAQQDLIEVLQTELLYILSTTGGISRPIQVETAVFIRLKQAVEEAIEQIRFRSPHPSNDMDIWVPPDALRAMLILIEYHPEDKVRKIYTNQLRHLLGEDQR